jgi:hypothetical protein
MIFIFTHPSTAWKRLFRDGLIGKSSGFCYRLTCKSNHFMLKVRRLDSMLNHAVSYLEPIWSI